MIRDDEGDEPIDGGPHEHAERTEWSPRPPQPQTDPPTVRHERSPADPDRSATSRSAASPRPADPVRASASRPADPAPAPERPIDEDETESNRSRVYRFARRLMDRKELAEDSKLLLSAFLSTSDKAKTEAVKLMAREFRGYLKELRLKEDLLELVRSHSLEISVHLKPLPPARDDEGSSGSGS